jgi:MFS family permease
MRPVEGRTLEARVMTPGHRPLTVGLVLVVTAIAFEALAVATALPVVSRELHGVRLYGWAFSAFMLANLVGITLGGPLADRIGPARPMGAALGVFSTGLLVSGVAPSMLVVVVGRAIAGLGAGALIATVYVVMGIGYPEAARARLFAVMSSAWVVPALVGPVIAGAVAEHVGWRAVFLGLCPVMALDAVLVLPATRALSHQAARDDAAGPPLPVADAVRLAAGAGVLLAGLGTRRLDLAAAGVAAGLLIGWRPFRRLTPEGTLRAAGALPSAVALRGLMAFAFFTFDGFLPLTLTSLRHQSATHAGLSLTAAGLSWATGSWVVDRRGARWGWRRTTTIGSALVLAGMGVSALVLVPSTPWLVAAAGWLVAGLGMGLCYPTVGLIVLEEAPDGGVGAASSAVQLADMLGVALGTGLAGAAVAYSVATGHGRRPGIEAADLMVAVVALIAVAVSRRVPARSTKRPHRDEPLQTPMGTTR